jgi:hypothetical protein
VMVNTLVASSRAFNRMIALFSLWSRTDVDALIERMMVACFGPFRQGLSAKKMAGAVSGHHVALICLV